MGWPTVFMDDSWKPCFPTCCVHRVCIPAVVVFISSCFCMHLLAGPLYVHSTVFNNRIWTARIEESINLCNVDMTGKSSVSPT